MGNDTNLWDDSALINAFDQAVNKYKVLHKGKTDFSSTEKEISTNKEIESSSSSHIPLNFSEPNITSATQLKSEAVLMTDSSVPQQLSSGEDYTQLVNQYYELEEKRQSVIQRLQEAGYWNYQENYRHAPLLPPCRISPYESEKREKVEEEVVNGETVADEVEDGETDLAAVVNAWYSAGFYTGRYLLEQSLKRRAQ